MPKKQAILDNVEEYSAAELAGYIKDGIVTLQELCNMTEGDFTPKMKMEVEAILNAQPAPPVTPAESENVQDEDPYSSVGAEEADWLVAKDSFEVDMLQKFKQKYPDSEHLFEANNLITLIENDESSRMNAKDILRARFNFANSGEEICDAIVDLKECGIITMDDVLDVIREDHNILSSAACSTILQRGIISRYDLRQCGIEDDFINKMMQNETSQSFEAPQPLYSIDSQCTEIYFWGIPSSGKTCALGGILSMAKSGTVARSMLPDNTCQGFGYMNRLSSLFVEGKICRLPGGTPVTSTYEMRFELQDNEMRIHPIACMDMAGELFTCLFNADAGEQLREDQQQALNTLDNILLNNRSSNRKIHFFVIEYGAEDRKYNDLPQAEYLNSAAMHLAAKGVFRDQTDAIYILITKTDKAKCGGSMEQHLKEYMAKNYLGFFNNMKRICEDNEINGGQVNIMPFSIGEVCFKDYCRFNGEASSRMVNLLLQRCYSKKPSKFGSFMDKFRG